MHWNKRKKKRQQGKGKNVARPDLVYRAAQERGRWVSSPSGLRPTRWKRQAGALAWGLLGLGAQMAATRGRGAVNAGIDRVFLLSIRGATGPGGGKVSAGAVSRARGGDVGK